MPTALKDFMTQRLVNVRQLYLDDLNAMPEELLSKSPGGAARTPFDFTYEVIVVNRRLATRMSGGDPGPANFDTWIKAPPEFANKEDAIRQFGDSAQAVIDAWKATPEEEMDRVIVLPKGETSPLDLASLAFSHMCYHDAQLNYAQTIAGDEQEHWTGEE